MQEEKRDTKMEKGINTTQFKEHLLISFIYKKGNCKVFKDFIKLLSITEEECHKLIRSLMLKKQVVYKNAGYEIVEENLRGYKFFNFIDSFHDEKPLKNYSENAIMYLPNKFLHKIER